MKTWENLNIRTLKEIVNKKIKTAEAEHKNFKDQINQYREQKIDENCEVFKHRMNMHYYWWGQIETWKEVRKLIE